MSSKFRIVVAAGGTGGHIFPAVAVVEELRRQLNGQVEVEFLGSRDRMEKTLLPALGYSLTKMPIQGFKGFFSMSLFRLPFQIWKSTSIARELIKAFKPHVVLCTGAYISYPAGIAARKEKVPLVLMESNFSLGKTNARLAKYAAKIVLSFEKSASIIPEKIRDRAVVLGNPVRNAITQMITVEEARTKLGLQSDLPTILVFGGSLGARSINNAVQKMLTQMAPDTLRRNLQIIWQTGRKFVPDVPNELRHVVRTFEFIDDMHTMYAAADLIVSRSGATTLAELGIVGKPAIFLPLPTASMNEQQHNAEIAKQIGAAVIVSDSDAEEQLPIVLGRLLDNPGMLKDMSAAMKTLGRPNAAADVVKLLQDVGRWKINGASI